MAGMLLPESGLLLPKSGLLLESGFSAKPHLYSQIARVGIFCYPIRRIRLQFG
jgi:hypothetical protein